MWPTLFWQHIHYQFKREEIEFPIIHRINSVFRRATNKWKVPSSRHSAVLFAVYQSTALFFFGHTNVLSSHRMMCSFGSPMWLSVRNGYVTVLFVLSATRVKRCVFSWSRWFSSLGCPHQATKGQISKVFSSMLAIHPDKPGKLL